MACIDWFLIALVVSALIAWLFREPAIPLPQHKRPMMNHLYNFRGWIPSVKNSQKKAAKFKALKERVDRETDYVNAARLHLHARYNLPSGRFNRYTHTKQKGNLYGKHQSSRGSHRT